MRFDSVLSHFQLDNQHNAPIPLMQQDFRHSGWPVGIPVVPGCPGARPGQNLDKNPQCDWLHLAVVPWCPVPSGGRRGRRSATGRAEPENDLEQKLDELFAQHAELMPRKHAHLIGIIYARFSTDFQHSISDQVRTLLERAVELNIHVPREFICHDQAVRGCQDRRPGLNRVRELLAKEAGRVLLVFTTNRLYRKLYKCMKFVEEEVHERGLRCIFVMSRIDTADGEQWRLPLQVHALVDEMTSTMYADNIRAAHMGLFVRRLVTTALPYGYMGVEVEGRPTKRNRPRREIAIDPVTSEIVKLIFQWFVHDRMGVNDIIARLNEKNAPLPTNCRVGYWHWKPVHGILVHQAYRGVWSYGEGENKWLNKKDYSKRKMRAKPLMTQIWEDFRLVSDEDWYVAQGRLAEFAKLRAGRKLKDPTRPHRPRVLNGFFICKKHDRPLRACGGEGQWICCSHCQALARHLRPIHTYLPRELAIKTVCRELAKYLRADETLFDDVYEACRLEVERSQKGDPMAPNKLRARLAKVEKQIEFLMNNAGESDSDRDESAHKLRQLRDERTQLKGQLAMHEAALARPTKVPSREVIREWFANLEALLIDTAERGEPADAAVVRGIIQKLTGGRIEIEQMGERRRQRGWLRGRFKLRLVQAARAELLNRHFGDDDSGPEITLDFKSETIAEQNATEAKRLYDAGELIDVIAERLDIERHQATEAVRIGYQREGLAPPKDGRVRRASVSKKHRKPPIFQMIADDVKRLYDEGMLYEDIAAKKGVTRDTIRDSLNYWFSSRGLTRPDGRNRRRDCPEKISEVQRGKRTEGGQSTPGTAA